jgi:hypothetical protein
MKRTVICKYCYQTIQAIQLDVRKFVSEQSYHMMHHAVKVCCIGSHEYRMPRSRSELSLPVWNSSNGKTQGIYYIAASLSMAVVELLV